MRLSTFFCARTYLGQCTYVSFLSVVLCSEDAAPTTDSLALVVTASSPYSYRSSYSFSNVTLQKKV